MSKIVMYYLPGLGNLIFVAKKSKQPSYRFHNYLYFINEG